MRAVRSIAGLVVVTLIGTAGFMGRPGASGRTVTVRRGDTLSAIAARAGTTVSAVAALNGIRDPDHVVIGAVLRLPSAGTVPAAATTYVVRPGDTASSIAGRFGTTVAALAAANGIENPNVVVIGTKLTVPASLPPPAVITGYANGGRGLPNLLVSSPDRVRLRPRFVHWAKAYGVPADLFQAMTWWESGWRNTVVSSTGAVGIGQLMPATVVFVNSVLLNGARLDPTKADDNIRMSARFIRALLDATGGKADLALASYYQGLASVRAGHIYLDTKHYVAGILAYRAHFG
ncbi:MAG: Lytic transglycosylase catalytic [Acidimicrobiales bacterium]|nr:Lytic transglycosylase catalytic [Acidimicrobiales bacterium]